VEIKGTVLFFVNPKVAHSIVRRVNRTGGYACIFTEDFVNSRELRESPLFRAGDNPVIPLNENETFFIGNLFGKMLKAYNGEYPHKADLIKSCIALIIHEALEIQPSQQTKPFINGTNRIANHFVELLEKQFPIERSNDPLKLRSPQDFAASLAVHVNYLNRAVKEVTGKPTSAHIADRIAAEAKALLENAHGTPPGCCARAVFTIEARRPQWANI
jgi:AraC family transcriptional activator of pobA